MYKRLIAFVLLSVPYFAMAHGEWTTPDNKEYQTINKDTNNDKEAKSSKSNKLLDAKYAAGTVPENDGKVEFETEIKVTGLSLDMIYQKTLDAITALTKSDNQHELSRITATNKAEHTIAAYLDEELELNKRALERDFTDMRYTIIATCHSDRVNVKMCRITYDYEKNRKTHMTYRAEELITDDMAIKKNGTELYRVNGKFRKKTIDRKDQIFAYFEDTLTKK